MFIPDSPTAIKVYEQKNAINKDAALGNYYISAEKYESLRGFEIFPDDIIVSCAGTIGETYVIPETMRKGIINQALMKISLYDLGIMDFYLIYFDCQLKNAAREQGHGVALKNIPPFDVLKKYLVPIPPIQEQGRIVQAVSDLLGKVNAIDTARDELFDILSYRDIATPLCLVLLLISREQKCVPLHCLTGMPKLQSLKRLDRAEHR